jgi:hypothetical protein
MIQRSGRKHVLGQDNDGEFDNARQKLSDLLAGPQRTWEAFVDSLFSVPSNSWSEWHTDTASYGDINPLDVVHHLLQRYVELTAHQFVAVSLWIMHTFNNLIVANESLQRATGALHGPVSLVHPDVYLSRVQTLSRQLESYRQLEVLLRQGGTFRSTVAVNGDINVQKIGSDLLT